MDDKKKTNENRLFEYENSNGAGATNSDVTEISPEEEFAALENEVAAFAETENTADDTLQIDAVGATDGDALIVDDDAGITLTVDSSDLSEEDDLSVVLAAVEAEISENPEFVMDDGSDQDEENIEFDLRDQKENVLEPDTDEIVSENVDGEADRSSLVEESKVEIVEVIDETEKAFTVENEGDVAEPETEALEVEESLVEDVTESEAAASVAVVSLEDNLGDEVATEVFEEGTIIEEVATDDVETLIEEVAADNISEIASDDVLEATLEDAVLGDIPTEGEIGATVAADVTEANATENTSFFKRHKRPLIITAIVLVLIIAYSVVSVAMTDVFPDGMTLNGIDVSGCTSSEVSALFDESDAITVSVSQDGSDAVEVTVSYEYDVEEAATIALAIAAIDPRSKFGMDISYSMPVSITGGYEETGENLEEVLSSEDDDITVTSDAYIDFETMSIVEEVQGENVDYEKVAEAMAQSMAESLNLNSFEFDFNSEDYISSPEVLAEDLADALSWYEEHFGDGLDITLPTGITYTITTSQLAEAISYNEDDPDNPVLDEGAMTALCDEIVSSYSKGSYIYVSTVNGTKYVYNNVLSDDVDYDATAESIYDAVVNGTTPEIEISEDGTSIKSRLQNRIEVSISQQKVYIISGGELIATYSCVTGGPGHRTPTGIYQIYYKTMNVTLVGDDYESDVVFWMPFNGGIGFHDASWRSSFGGSIYVNDGSHGCVNLPYAGAQDVYNHVFSGTVVIVYS